jgi:hypothetical protein
MATRTKFIQTLNKEKRHSRFLFHCHCLRLNKLKKTNEEKGKRMKKEKGTGKGNEKGKTNKE